MDANLQATLEDARRILIDRAAKYANDENLWINFETMAEEMDMPIGKVFDFYRRIKLNRLRQSQEDFNDESVYDTLIDIANYSLLEAARIRAKKSSHDLEVKYYQIYLEELITLILSLDQEKYNVTS